MAGWNKTILTICGGGHVARSVAAMAMSRDMFDIEILVLGDRPNVPDTKTTVVEVEDSVRAEIVSVHLPEITSSPESCISQSSVILFILEPCEHEQYLNAIKEYIAKGTVIIALPSTPCFELLCSHILGEAFNSCNIISCDDVPWDARAAQNEIEIKYARHQLVGSLVSRCRPKRPPFFSLQVIFGRKPALVIVKSWVEQTLICNYFAFINTAIMYSGWKGWDGKSVEEIPYFYRNLTDDCISLIENIDDEIENTALALMKDLPRCEFDQVMPFRETLKRKFKSAAGIKSISEALKKHAFFADKQHLMSESSNGLYDPDFKAMANELEYFMLPLYNIARLCEVPALSMKSVIEWFQKVSVREYLIDNELKGADVDRTRCPARFNINSLEDLVSFR